MRNVTKIIFAGLGLCAGLFLLAACTPSVSPQSGQGSLTGPVWGLTMLVDQPLVAGTEISAQFTADGKVNGSSGCNQYSGTYTVSGSSIQIATPMASTMMSCEQAIMDQESAYLEALGKVKSFSVSGSQMTLMDENKKNLLVYEALSQDLADTTWEAISYNNGKQAVTSVLAGTTITAQFGKDGTLSGSSGCNTYSGTYNATGRQITIGPLVATQKACGDPAGVMEQEAQYLAALGTVATYQLEGSTLELRTKDGALAVQYHKK